MLALLILSPSALAGTQLQLRRLQAPGVQLDGVALSLQPGAGTSTLELAVDRVDIGGHPFRALHWRCALQRSADGHACVGPVRLAGAALGRLALDWPGAPRLQWTRGPALIRWTQEAGGSTRFEIERFQVAWLQALLQSLLPQLLAGSGEVSGTASYTATDDRGALDLRVRGLALDSTGGRIAAAGIDADLVLAVRDLRGAHPDARVALDLAGGELLAGALYAQIAGGSRLVATLDATRADGWRPRGLHLDDPDGLAVDLQADWSQGDLAGWSAELSIPHLAQSAPRYLDGLLATVGLPASRWQGGARARLRGRGLQLDEAQLAATALRLDEPSGRVSIAGVDGSLGWTRDTVVRSGSLRWQALAALGIDVGAGEFHWQTRQATLQLEQALVLHPFGGRLRIDTLEWQPLQAQLLLGSAVEDLDLAAMMAQFGWPAIPGRLSGSLPRMRYADSMLDGEGELQVRVLGGTVTLRGLHMERPFGLAPSFGAEIGFDDLDLAPLTGAFGFGEITGRLDGQVQGLRMLDWSPVAFDARLRTDPTHAGKQRISQRAVQDLSSVGGGLVAGLQNQLLRMFDSFAYKRIGLSCRLENNVCHMGGLDSSANGYTVVEGAGLPRITVNGFQQRVDWPVLLARLKAATAGKGPRIE